MRKRWMIEKKLVILMVAITLSLLAMPVKAQVLLTKEEQEYVDNINNLKAVSIEGTAPLHYIDANGQAKGISIDILETISNMTGLSFTYQLFNTLDEMQNSNADIVFGIPDDNAVDNIALSMPYLESETILYIHSSVNPNKLDDKRYAAVKGIDLPKGIQEEDAIYFETREACMNAVDCGQADYGYGNAFSVAFYTLQNNYRNIITVPEKKEIRKYCIGLMRDDEMLLSIINKAISSIDESQMRTLVLDAATQVEMKVTIPMIIEAYGGEISGAVLLIMVVLLISFVHNVKAKNEIKRQYERYQILSQTSNEYLYEYHVKSKKLELSKTCVEFFGDASNLSVLKAEFENVLTNRDYIIPIMELPIANGEKSLFKSVNSFLYDDKGKVYSIIGKLVDVKEEEAEKKELIKRSETDGMTGIYNSTTTKNLITECMKNAKSASSDALIVIDCDNFKEINDTYGHLQGDKVIINISKVLVQIFRRTDIIGRIGGDEFCVYMQDIPSSDFVVSKCQQLMALLGELDIGCDVTVSIGISMRGNEKSYDELFKKADKALYDAKKKGRDRIQLFQ